MTEPTVPLERGGTVVRRSSMFGAGFTRTAIDRSVRRRELAVPYRGIYVAGDVDRQARNQAALFTEPNGTLLSHMSAAVALALPWLPDEWCAPGRPVHLTAPAAGRRRQRDGLRVRYSAVPARDVRLVDGLPVTSPARTLIDLIRSRDAGRLLGLQLLDGALRFGHCTADDLTASLDTLVGSPGVQWARRLVTLARPGVDSPGETWLRLTLIDGGVRPEDIDLPLVIRDDGDGEVLAKGDLGSTRLLLWGEYDGYDVHTRRPAFGGDRVGDRWLSDRGWQVLRFSAVDRERPGRVVADWRRAVHHAPARILAMDPGRSPEVAEAQAQLRSNGHERA